MDLFLLETFVTVAREGSFSRAAAKLHRTQPAVSQAIRKLERELGEPLLDRSSRDCTLTDAGQLLLDYSQRLLSLRSETFNALSELRQWQAGKLAIAANEFTCQYLLPVLHEFRKLYPLIKVTVQRSLASLIPDAVCKRHVELGVVSFHPDDPLLRCIVVYRDQLAFVAHPGHPLASVRVASIRQLGAESFVAHHVASPYRTRVLQAFRRHKTPLNMPVELPTLEAIKKFVALGNGVALVPGICVQAEVERGELVRIPVRELRIERRLRLVYRKNASLSHAARAFLQVAESMARNSAGGCLYKPER